ncbi:PE-PPE domain-containing protein [Mycobacterium attenuatum]|uniref:PE-PPE domain-containing protein n=1 Tax=Mycobacterium attenuatum TaxID=2341086 RepID=UPI000F043E21|nr:PE-PPE domain-containing protein [Mycobacterium attenuatum]VBA56932.1 putative PPE family protein PPE42 [Mycobacterium attenuatum]
MNFAVLPPEINSARMYSGAGLGPMLAAATAWDGLAAELGSAATSFESLTSGLVGGPWQGAASTAMLDAAALYMGWLQATAGHAGQAAAQARFAVSAFEAAQPATVHPAIIAANRSQLVSLVMSNLFGQNAPAIAFAEATYEQMWAQDVAAMLGYHLSASAAAASLPPWQELPQHLADMANSTVASWNLPNVNVGGGNTGSFNIGTGNTGNFNIGNNNTGNFNIGNANFGSFNLGFDNIGNFNAGWNNYVNANIGTRNVGQFNIGYENAGTANVGIWNVGERNIGLVNIGEGWIGYANPQNGDVGVTSVLERLGGGGAVFTLGGTALSPLPRLGYSLAVTGLYVEPVHAGSTAFPIDFKVEPSKLWPLTGLGSLSLDQSVARGVADLNAAIMEQFVAGSNTVVLGYSQSAVVVGQELRYLATLPADQRPTLTDLSFVLIGDPSNPNGGVLSRFPGVHIPFLDFTFFPATPANVYPTTVYTLEYSGIGDFPQYPINILSDVNAVAGALFLHSQYPGLTPEYVATGVVQPVTPGSLSTYIMIPVQDLPILGPLRQLPFVGEPLADLIQPNLKVLVNWGYGNLEHGYSQGPADVPTPAGLFPDISLFDVAAALQRGTVQGINDFLVDLGLPPTSSWLPRFP